MSIRIHKLKEGEQYTLYALGIGKNVDLLDFLDEMERKRPNEAAKMGILFKRIVEHGIPKNREKCRPLKDKLFELKTTGGLRIVCFWDKGQMIICTHGFKKQGQKTPRKEIRKGSIMKDDYFKAKANGTLIWEE